MDSRHPLRLPSVGESQNLVIARSGRAPGSCDAAPQQDETATIDDQTGRSFAVIEANYLNGLRASAVNAPAVRALAREQAATLGVIGIGSQALFEGPCGDVCRANSTHPGRWTVGEAT